MKLGIYFNRHYLADNKAYVETILRLCKSYNAECIIVENISSLDNLDVLFVLGGDGTILTVATECALRGVKIIGINYGHVGFLAEFERERLEEAVDLVCKGNYKVKRRSMLEAECGDKKFYALNDLVLQRSTGGKYFLNTVSIHAEIDGVTVDNFSSDGIIVSTPTGSTAYSLAAGGSVLTPDINAFILTPVCSHSLHSRPVVYEDNSVLTLTAVNSTQPMYIIVDGWDKGEIKSGEVMTVRKSDIYAEFITENDKDFFNKLLIKLNKWSK